MKLSVKQYFEVNGKDNVMQNEKILAVDFSKQDTSLLLFERSPLLTSHAARWNGIHLEFHHQPPAEESEYRSLQHLIFIHTLPAPSTERRLIDRCLWHEEIAQGDVGILPANISCQTQRHLPCQFIMLCLEPTQFSRAIYESIEPERVELLPHFPKPDPLIYQIGLALKAELERDRAGSRLYAEAMANAMIVHLLKHYAVHTPVFQNYSGGLSRSKLKQVIDYIHNHLDQDLSLNALAAMVHMSPTYFARLFKQSTGFAPHQYIIHHRIELAKRLLFRPELSITEIAYRVGFANQGHFNRHFKKLTGMTPGSIRQQS